jgi:hypothetical protein
MAKGQSTVAGWPRLIYRPFTMKPQITEKSEWQQCVVELQQEQGITFKAFHRDDQHY